MKIKIKYKGIEIEIENIKVFDSCLVVIKQVINELK